MRLLDMGIEVDKATRLTALTGAFCMKSIQIFDGNKLLDQVQEASIYKTFQNFNHTNDSSISVQSYLDKTRWAFQGQSTTTWDSAHKPDIPGGDIVAVSEQGEIDDTATELQKQKSWFSLKGFLPFLSSSLYVPSSVFKDLRVVVQWKSPSELQNLIVDRTADPSTYQHSSLVVDEVVGGDGRDAALKAYKGVVFKAIEHDSVHVNSVAPAADKSLVQPNRFLVNGFNNKTVERLLVVQTPLDSTTWIDGTDTKGLSNQASQAQLNNEFQFRVNGQNVLPRTGYTKKNQRLASLTDSYGECCLIPTGNFTYVPRMGNFVDSADFDDVILGATDYTCVEVRRPVTEMIVEYNRTGVAGAANASINQPLRLNLFGECMKSIRVDGDKYVISYM
tara:strand:+ start:2447 stop:3619 length:1173 start_codon:yes stop_codon:yes gene_type:complete